MSKIDPLPLHQQLKITEQHDRVNIFAHLCEINQVSIRALTYMQFEDWLRRPTSVGQNKLDLMTGWMMSAVMGDIRGKIYFPPRRSHAQRIPDASTTPT